MAKGSLTSFSCAVTPSADGIAPNGFALQTEYIVGAGGEQITAIDGQGNWLRSNVAAGAALVSYDGQGRLHYALSDGQGTKRMLCQRGECSYTRAVAAIPITFSMRPVKPWLSRCEKNCAGWQAVHKWSE